MICFNVSLITVAAFLLLTLVVGIVFSRKQTTFREYAVGNKQFSTATLVATVLATAFSGGGLIRNVQEVHNIGLWWITLMLLAPFSCWLVGSLALRMGRFMQHLSMADTMGSIYGKYVGIITALSSICASIVMVTAQINVITMAINMCVNVANLNINVITAFATLIVIIYSMFGGIRSVTFTDLLQFVTFSIIIPLLTWYMLRAVGKPFEEIIPYLQQQEKFQFSTVFHWNTNLIALIVLCLSNTISAINPPNVQRVYMSSGPIQARRVFLYSTLFEVIIIALITLVGIFVFVNAPDLQKAEVWDYIMTHIPSFFKGLLAISLLAMAMSTADSYLNICSVMISHDIVKRLQNKKATTDALQVKVARRATLVVGLLAMLLAFKCKDLFRLLCWTLNCSIPIVSAPFILAIFGFQGTSRTALIGMVTGLLAILTWDKWIQPLTGIDGSCIAMLANGLAMIAVHYLFKQPEEAGWGGPDDQFKQLQQERARKRMERKEAIKNAWANRKIILSKLKSNHITMVYVGCYIVITILLSYFIVPIMHNVYWIMLQLLLAACLIGYPFVYDISKKIRTIPDWCIGLCWLMALVIYLPLSLLGGDWWNVGDLIFNLSIFLMDAALILWVLPLYLGIGVVTAISLVVFYKIFFIRVSCYPLLPLFLLFLAMLLVFAIAISFKRKLNHYKAKILYLENQEKNRESQQLKASLYDAAAVPTAGKAKGYGAILTQVIGKIEESISFLDSNVPLYKQDFQSIINKLYDWVAYFNRRAKAKKHALLQPTQITLDKLIRKLELALSHEVADPPRLLVEKVSGSDEKLSAYMVCDIYQVVYLLVQAVLRIAKLDRSGMPLVKIQLHDTSLQFKQADPVDSSLPAYILFQATALVISQATAAPEALPKVKQVYDDEMDAIGPKGKQGTPPSIDLQQETLSSIVGAHYGYWETFGDQQQSAMLLVLPNDVTDIFNKVTITLPLDALTLEAPVTPKEQADSMMVLMKFHDYVCKSSYQMDPVDVGTISGLLLLLRQHFGFKRHASGQLFYVRAVGIAELVVEWAFHSPKVIYAALLYELVRRTCLPLSYVKEHYNLGVYAFVLNVVGIDKRQALDHSSLLYVQNRLKEAIKEEHVQLSVLFIKLAERLYDLRHAAGYIHLPEVQHMAQETLSIDVKLADTYLGPEIGQALEEAAKAALNICKIKEVEREKQE
ncbi:sodium:solute symporter family transporter [Cardinium endosymbiont of Philonthus spinipes]|uniref:sodium:solute symporter family transporter n=1 Tax=Cardinium endosymbiont of Philonthus spinipes TaxID=3077941 RepID=UPI00313AFF61